MLLRPMPPRVAEVACEILRRQCCRQRQPAERFRESSEMKSRLRAWVRQRPRDIAQRGKRKSPWVVYWNDPDGIRREQTCGVGRDGWLQAEKEKVRIHEQLLEGKSAVPTEVRWCDFRDEFEENTLSRRAASTRGTSAMSRPRTAQSSATPGRTTARTSSRSSSETSESATQPC